jgi:hypothetical protein
MAGEVDRLLLWMGRVEKLEGQLENSGSAEIGLVRAWLDRARQAEQAAIRALVSAAHEGDPEALVALEALQEEIEEKTWRSPTAA